MRRFLFLLVMLLGLWGPGVGLAQQTLLHFDDPAQEERFRKLTQELRCLVCQNESLADSNADLADDLRIEVYDMMQKGLGDKQIVDFLVQRYGDFVRYRPPVKPATYLLWFGPAAFGVAGVLILLLVIRRRGRKRAEALSEQERARLDELMRQGEKGAGP